MVYVCITQLEDSDVMSDHVGEVVSNIKWTELPGTRSNTKTNVIKILLSDQVPEVTSHLMSEVMPRRNVR